MLGQAKRCAKPHMITWRKRKPKRVCNWNKLCLELVPVDLAYIGQILLRMGAVDYLYEIGVWIAIVRRHWSKVGVVFNAEQLELIDRPAGLFEHLAHKRIGQRLARLAPPAWQDMCTVGGAHEHYGGVVQHDRADRRDEGQRRHLAAVVARDLEPKIVPVNDFLCLGSVFS